MQSRASDFICICQTRIRTQRLVQVKQSPSSFPSPSAPQRFSVEGGPKGGLLCQHTGEPRADSVGEEPFFLPAQKRGTSAPQPLGATREGGR